MTNTATPIAITFRRLTSTGAPSTDGGGLGSAMVPPPCPSTRVPSIHQPSWSRWERPTTIELRSQNAQHALKLFLRGYESGASSDTGRSNGSGWTSAPGADSPDEQKGTHNRRPCWTLACTAIDWSPLLGGEGFFFPVFMPQSHKIRVGGRLKSCEVSC